MRRVLLILLPFIFSPAFSHATPQDAPTGRMDFRFFHGDAKTPETKETREAAAKRSVAFAKLQKILKSEPTAKEVQRATLAFYKLEPERLARMGTASRAKGIVPDITAGINNSMESMYSNLKDGLYPLLSNGMGGFQPYKEQTTQNTSGLTWNVQGTFYLDRLVFNSEELDVRSLNAVEETLVREVTTLYFQRHRLIANLLLTPPEGDEQIYFDLLRLDEMTATLDALTGGMFAHRAWKWESEVQADRG